MMKRLKRGQAAVINPFAYATCSSDEKTCDVRGFEVLCDDMMDTAK